jgi:hypothetical protein
MFDDALLWFVMAVGLVIAPTALIWGLVLLRKRRRRNLDDHSS